MLHDAFVEAGWIDPAEKQARDNKEK